MNFINWFFINFAIMISAIGHARGFMAAWKNSTKKEVVEQKLIAKSANAQFESLKNQLDPHFLFNSLNVLDSLIEENPERKNSNIICKYDGKISKVEIRTPTFDEMEIFDLGHDYNTYLFLS